MTNFLDKDGELPEMREMAREGLAEQAIALALIDIALSLRALAFVYMNQEP